MPRHLTARLRNATPDDVRAIKCFLWRNPSPNIKLRPTAAYERSIADNIFYIVEVERRLKLFGRYKIVGVGGIFPLSQDVGSTYELGNLYIKRRYRGFGLQSLMMSAGVSAATVFDQKAHFLAGVRHGKGADDSRRNTIAAGFVELPPEHPLAGKPCQSCDSRPPSGSMPACCGTFFELAAASQCGHVRRLLALPAAVSQTSSKGDLLDINVQVQIVTNRGMRAALDAWLLENCAGAR